VLNLRLDEVTAADRLLHIETPVAEAAELLHEGQPAAWPLDIPAGRDTVLGEHGLQLRLLRLTQALEIGRSYPLRLVFEQGGAVNAQLNVDYGRFF
jgi:copper(I)-binding protein